MVLLTVRGSLWISNSWKQELVITETAVYAEVMKGLRRIKISLPFDRIAQVVIIKNPILAEIEIVNKGGYDNIRVRAISKRDAEAAKALIEKKMQAEPRGTIAPQERISIADELGKLAILKGSGILTDDEFLIEKQKVLANRY